MIHEDDNDLRERFQSLREEDQASSPRYSTPPRTFQLRHSPLRGMAAVAATVVAIAGALAVGLVWGTKTGYATGRVEGDRQREAIVANARGATSQLSALRFELARTRSRLELRGVGSASVAAVDAELAAIASSIERIEADLATPPSALRPLPSTSTSMNRALALTCSALTLGTQAVQPQEKPVQQQGIPIVELPAATSVTPTTLVGPIGVRHLSSGKVMINDGRGRQIKLYDSTLTHFTMVSDSIPGTSTYYGPWGTQIVRWFGDTSLFVDWPSQTILVLNQAGDVSRVMAPPNDGAMLGSLIATRAAGIDPQGRLIYGSMAGTRISNYVTNGRRSISIVPPPDSMPIVRANLATRAVDTIARAMRGWIGGRLDVVQLPNDKGPVPRTTLNPLIEIDDWSVLSDGTLAVVRGHDYSIDWFAPDGSRTSSGKLPFDWKRVTDADKQRLIDSMKSAHNVDARNAASQALLNNPPPDGPPTPSGGGGRGGRSGGGGTPAGGRGASAHFFEIAKPGEIPDFYPPIRDDAAIPDLDGNLWVLPTTSAQSKQGELVYDVINPKRGLFQRVRVPLGRSILGFGPNGVVYLMSGDKVTGFKVEKTRLR